MRFFVILLLIAVLTGNLSKLAAQDADQIIPEPVPLLDTSGSDIVNFLLLGSDTSDPQNSGRTDVIMVVSVNRTYNSVAFLSIPRDLYVYIPGWQAQKINTAYGHGEMIEEGQGPTLLMDTLKYHLGISIDYYARVDFNDFRYIIDAVGGIEVSVDCAIEDWRLREPQLDPTVEDNWVMYTLPIGVHQMDSDTALWYARSRRTSSDFDRGQRQQEIMRALWRHLRNLGLINQLPDIWSQMGEIVETNIPLPDLLSLLPLAIELDENRVSSYRFQLNQEVINSRASDGAQVLLPQPAAIATLMQHYLSPPTMHQLRAKPVTLKVVNVSGNPDLARIVVDKAAWHGIIAVADSESPVQIRQSTMLYDYTGQSKGGNLDLIQSALGISEQSVVLMPDPEREYDYEVVIGSYYYPCTRDVLPPSSAGAATS